MSEEWNKLTISRYHTRHDKDKELTIEKISWPDLVKILTTVKRTKESFEEFQSLTTEDKASIKDQGWLVGGEFNPPLRKKGNLVGRDVLLLDADHMELWDVDPFLDSYKDKSYAVHSTHSHSLEQPRLRIAFPFTRTVTPAEYEAVARRVAEIAGMDYFDDTTYQNSRIMFLPSASHDAPFLASSNKGDWIDPDAVLATYKDPADWEEWPQSSAEIEKGGLRERKDKAADPFEIPGIIGAFCRAYPIDEAILEFSLPYEESGMGEDRYSYLGGSGADGAVFYRDDGHLHSWHESDPAHGNRNAWDLVRLHRYSALDREVPKETPIKDYPSQRAMVRFAETLSPVREEWDDSARAVIAEEEFDDVTNEAGEKVESIGYESLVESISAHEKLTPDAHKDYVLQAAIADLTATEVAGVAASLADKERTAYPGSTKSNVKGEIESKRKQLKKRQELDAKDPQKEMLAHFEKKFYNDGKYIKRHGGVFWKYTGTHWKTVDAEIVNSGMLDAISDITSQAEGNKERARLNAAFGDKETSSVWNSLRLMYQSIVSGRTAREAIDEDDPMGLMRTGIDEAINCASGTIRFNREGKFKQFPHKPEDLFTSVVPVEYDRDAECPVWDRFCKVSFQHAKDPIGLQRHLEEICGYILNISRRERCWIMLYGPTNSGKSTVGKVLKEMMGITAKPMNMGNYEGGNSHATAGLLGKQLVFDDDYASKKPLNDSFIKMNSEEKHIGYNPKGAAEGELVSRAVIMMFSNIPPLTDDVSGALYDRAVVLPFNHTVPEEEKDKRLIEKLKLELPGIFLRFVRAFAELTARGGWDFPEDATDAWEKWKGDSNPLPLFLSQCYEKSFGERVAPKDLHAKYKAWIVDQGYNIALPQNKLYSKIDGIWGNRVHTRDGDRWEGYKLIPGATDERSAGERDNDDTEFGDQGPDEEVDWDT